MLIWVAMRMAGWKSRWLTSINSKKASTMHGSLTRKIPILILSALLLPISRTSVRAQGLERMADKRMAAHHYAVVTTGTALPNSAVLTYPVNEFRVQDYNFLLKLMPCLVMEGETIFPLAQIDYRNRRP